MSREGELDETLPSDSDSGAATGATATMLGGARAIPAEARDPAMPATISRFEIDGKLGAGAMGVVLLATDPMLGRKVALKLMREGTANPDRTRRFVREAQAMAKVIHENVIVVHEVGTHDGQVYVAMEHVSGGTLARWQRGRPWREIVETYLRAGRGLAAAHDAGLVHRDFKPENVLIADDGRVRVTDFGLVSALEGAAAEPTSPEPAARLELDHSLTNTGALLGTPRYMAPEQHLGEPVDARADQYSFCVALYEALYGVAPYDADTYAELATRAIEGTPPSPPTGKIPAPIRAALIRGLSRQRADRFPSMRELLAAISAGIEKPRRRSWVTATAFAIAIAGTGALAWRMHVNAQRADDLAEELDQLKMKSVAMTTVSTSSGSATPLVSDADVKRAQKLFDDAQTAFRANRFDEAATGFLAAYEQKPYAQFLYNAAAAYQMKGRTQKNAAATRAAIANYRRYLAESPHADDRAKVEHTIEALEDAADQLDDAE